MALSVGTRLGPYEITGSLGAGGMGEVYKARDTRLDRTVAIKVLAPSVATDVEFRARFDREARTISQLDHPHICALYDVGRENGVDFLVMQYLDGETLAQRLARTPKTKRRKRATTQDTGDTEVQTDWPSASSPSSTVESSGLPIGEALTI